jgi:hypothetical protein
MAHLFLTVRANSHVAGHLPYESKALLTDGELRFYDTLRRAVAGRWGISLKTRLADLVGCPPDLWDSPHGRRLAQKHVDFVLYQVMTTRVLAVLELDDRSHNDPTRRKRDRFVDTALQAVDIRVLRVRASRRYDVTTVGRYLDRALT